MLTVNHHHLEHALTEYVAHFNHHRPHPQHTPTSACGVAIGSVG